MLQEHKYWHLRMLFFRESLSGGPRKMELWNSKTKNLFIQPLKEL